MSNNLEQVSVPLPAELREFVARVAEAEDRSQASVIRRLVADANRANALTRAKSFNCCQEGGSGSYATSLSNAASRSTGSMVNISTYCLLDTKITVERR